MLFNSLQFLVFFPVVTLIYFLLPHKWRWLHLLIASCIFYMYFIPIYILILIFTIIIDYYAGILIENATGKRRKWYLVMSLVANIGVLAVFKYYNFFIDNVNELLRDSGSAAALPFLNIILPIGLSFHTFQAMSYTIEVYRGHHAAERHFGIYALYVMFYPQLVAGPIERPQNVLYQFHEKKEFDYDNVTDGLKQMMWGMFKKVVIADRLVKFTDPVFNHPHEYTPMAMLLGAIFFSFQIFCDFSGYSDIALGSAKVMGFKLMKNFDKPYHAKDISEFWRRWHISLSTWFRDYLYISLGGNRVSIPRWYFNLFFVFLVSGFWHGANWTFIIWGALHGFYLVFAIVSQKARTRLNQALGITRVPWLYTLTQVLTTYCLVTFAWIFFRANNIKDALYIAGRIPVAIGQLGRFVLSGHYSKDGLQAIFGILPLYQTDLVLCFLVIIVLEAIHFFQRKNNILSLVKARPLYQRWALYYLMIMIIIFFGVYENRQFIYFQF
ncbi:MAG: MBOAT family protein [Bacteroidetes bacterium]|nr:MBOAT family protein [Bacteroidota bacterium]